jgi:hypothetical protein
MAYSAGFTPHPKVSYANARPPAAASEAEYLEIALASAATGACCARRWTRALPDGLGPRGRRRGRVPAPWPTGCRRRSGGWSSRRAPAALRRPSPTFLAAERVEVAADDEVRPAHVRRPERRRAGARRPVPRRESARVRSQVRRALCAILQVVVRHATPAVRPDDVLAALRAVADLAPPSPPW